MKKAAEQATITEEVAIDPLSYSIPRAALKISDPPPSRATMYRLVGLGKLELVKIGSRSAITARSIHRLIDRAA